nr:hypothetical protein Iba_chr03aCG2430 [Ipomoea batatas]
MVVDQQSDHRKRIAATRRIHPYHSILDQPAGSLRTVPQTKTTMIYEGSPPGLCFFTAIDLNLQTKCNIIIKDTAHRCLKQTKHISSVRQAINMRNRFAATIMPALTSKLLPTLDSSSVVGAGDAAGVTIFGGSGGDKIFLGLGAAGVIGPAG